VAPRPIGIDFLESDNTAKNETSEAFLFNRDQEISTAEFIATGTPW
jgi:hypothetical protein